MTRLPSCSSMRKSFSFSPSSILSTGTPVQRETTCATWSAVTASSTIAPLPSAAYALELLLDFRNAAVGKLAGALIFAFALGVGELDPQMIELGLELLGVRKLVLLGLPARREIGGLLLEHHQFLLEPLVPLLRTGVALFAQRLLLDLEPHDLAIDRIQLLGLGIDLHLESRSRLVDQVDRFVRQRAIGDVAV